MGGVGSGRWMWHQKATLVEFCTIISTRQMRADGLLKGLLQMDWASFRVGYGFNQQIIFMTPWRPKLGGKAWMMLCPACNLRCLKLYSPQLSPPIEFRFLCRSCWRLSYKSAQAAHRWDRGYGSAFCASLAFETGLSIHQVIQHFEARKGARNTQSKR